MAVTALYRLRSGEVGKISLKGQPFSDRNPAYWGVVTDPILPDGSVVRVSLPDGTLGPMRVLGVAKHYVGIGQEIRNATQAEIDTYAAAAAEDEQRQDADRVGQLFETHPQWRKVFKALIKRILAVTNAHAKQHNALRAQIAAATNLANLQQRVAANTADLPTPTLAQALVALRSDISKDD